MKSDNLFIMKQNNILVPDFISVSDFAEIDLSFSNSELFAVRSSYEGEDGDDFSHAGQFDTFLNIKREDVKEYAKKVKDGYGGNNKSTIIIQEMVESEFSGVIFTANPMGILNELVIVTGNGLGDNIVEDKINTTTYYYNLDDKVFYFSGENILKKEILEKIVETATSIKNIFKKDMDIEFAVAKNTLYILQARPITTLKYDNVIILDNSNIIESYPGISLPLTQSFAKKIYADVFTQCIYRISKKNTGLINEMKPGLDNMLEYTNGRIYYNINNWYLNLKLLPFSKKLIKIWQEMLGVENKYVDNAKIKVGIVTKLKIVSSFIYYLLSAPKHMNWLNNYFDEKIGDFSDEIDNSKSIEELIEVFYSIESTLKKNWDITLINDMYTFIYTGLLGKKGKERISSIKNLESMKPVKALNELISLYNQDNNSAEFKNAFEGYIEQYGDRCLGELKLETKTYRTNPELLLEYIKTHTVSEINESDTKKKGSLFLRRAKAGIYNREISRLNRTKIFGLTRKIFIRISEFMVNDGLIDNKEDIFYLYLEEINNLNEYKSVIEFRKEQYKQFEMIPAFSRLVFSGKIIDKQFDSINTIDNNNKMFGIGSSAGDITGEAIVINDISTDIDVKDKIIIAQSTDPGWVFLIKDAKGIIVERGSILSHTAIITRELKKPSIVNVRNVTNIIKTGDIVRLNAYTGEVEIL